LSLLVLNDDNLRVIVQRKCLLVIKLLLDQVRLSPIWFHWAGLSNRQGRHV